MNKLTKEEYIKRTDEIENVLFKNLPLREELNDEELTEFFITFIAYLMHGKTTELVGRTPETLEKNINNFIEFSNKIGLNYREIIDVIKKFPSILHSIKDIENKYIFLSLIENENNTLRKTKLIERPRDYIVELDTLYSRYFLAKDLNYPLTWNSLVKNSEKEFASIFTKIGYSKPYKIFDAIEDCSSERLKEKYPLDNKFIDELRMSELNNFGGLSEKTPNRR